MRKFQYQHLLQQTIRAQPFKQASTGGGQEFTRKEQRPRNREDEILGPMLLLRQNWTAQTEVPLTTTRRT